MKGRICGIDYSLDGLWQGKGLFQETVFGEKDKGDELKINAMFPRESSLASRMYSCIFIAVRSIFWYRLRYAIFSVLSSVSE